MFRDSGSLYVDFKRYIEILVLDQPERQLDSYKRIDAHVVEPLADVYTLLWTEPRRLQHRSPSTGWDTDIITTGHCSPNFCLRKIVPRANIPLLGASLLMRLLHVHPEDNDDVPPMRTHFIWTGPTRCFKAISSTKVGSPPPGSSHYTYFVRCFGMLYVAVFPVQVAH